MDGTMEKWGAHAEGQKTRWENVFYEVPLVNRGGGSGSMLHSG